MQQDEADAASARPRWEWLHARSELNGCKQAEYHGPQVEHRQLNSHNEGNCQQDHLASVEECLFGCPECDFFLQNQAARKGEQCTAQYGQTDLCLEFLRFVGIEFQDQKQETPNP